MAMGSVGRQRQAAGVGVLSSRDKGKEREERRRGVGWAGFRRKCLKKTGSREKCLVG
jgi:hypothetical protein